MTPITSSSETGLVLTVTRSQQEFARLLAKARMAGHSHCRRPDQDRGSHNANYKADCFGALAEIVVISECERLGLVVDHCLIADRPPTDPDITLGRTTFDIKSCLPGKRYLCVNFAQFHNVNRTKPDYILPVAFDSACRLRVFAPVPYAAVRQWDLRQDRHSPYYSTALSSLRPLSAWETLTRPGDPSPY